MSILLAPSMLSANFGQLDKDVELVNEGAADWFHLDIMDGVFVPNISYGFPVVKAMAKKAKKPYFSNREKGASTVKQFTFILPVCLII